MQPDFPWIIKEVGFDFSWDEKKVWQLSAPVSEMDIQELLWHFDIPFLWTSGGYYNLTPWQVIRYPHAYEDEHLRTYRADLAYPIDIMENKGRWLILDGLHRLMKAYQLNHPSIKVRKIPRSEIPNILKN